MPRFYTRDTVVPFEEDFTHEFKGHRNICLEDLPPWTQETKTEKASRRAASRALNAFLNTGKGGIVYLGVIDSGKVKGLKLSDYQKDHVVQSVVDLMNRYSPPVGKHRYSVKFVPVYDSEEEGEKRSAMKMERRLDPSLEGRAHYLRSYNYCWCDRDAVMQYNAGIMHEDYVIEIKAKPWDPDNPLNAEAGCGRLINLHPVHDNEEGKCFFRRQASVVQYTMTELAQLTRHEIQEGCMKKISSLRKEIDALKRLQEETASSENG